MHLRGGADLVNLVRGRFLNVLVEAGHQGDDAVFGQVVFHEAHAAPLTDGQRQPHHGVDDHAAQGQHGQIVRGDLVRLLFFKAVAFGELFRLVQDLVFFSLIPFFEVEVQEIT